MTDFLLYIEFRYDVFFCYGRFCQNTALSYDRSGVMTVSVQTLWPFNFTAVREYWDSQNLQSLWPVRSYDRFGWKRYNRSRDKTAQGLYMDMRYDRFEQSLWRSELKGGCKTSSRRYTKIASTTLRYNTGQFWQRSREKIHGFWRISELAWFYRARLHIEIWF